jgi:phage repressor protein C with HTH and peptisase S24 domain
MRDRAIRENWPSIKVPGRGPEGTETKFRPPDDILAVIRGRSPDAGLPKPIAEQDDTSLDDFVLVPFFDVRASAGHGAFIAGQAAVRHYAFDHQWIAQQIGLSVQRLALIPVSGNSMEPDLFDGDLVMIDRGDTEILREGVYVFEVDDGLFVKRLSLRGDKLVIDSSNNTEFPPKEISLMRENPSFRLHGRVIGSPTFKRF